MAHRLPIIASRSAVYGVLPPRPPGFRPQPLTDAQGREYRYLRLSVTDRCNFGCTYCMPPGGEDEHAVRRELLNFEECTRLARLFSGLGFHRLRFTGGEPLVRKDFLRLVSMVHAVAPDLELVLTTNASRLGELAAPLREAGISGVNVSIDTLDPERFREVTRGGELAPVLRGIDAAVEAGFEVKLNTVALGGLNEGELAEIVDFAWDREIMPRFIELMPIGEGAELTANHRLSQEEILSKLGHRASERVAPKTGGSRGPAVYFREAGKKSDLRRVGIISAVSENFCSTCNRLRVTAHGDLRPCLANRRAVSLRDLMRAGADDRELAWALHWAVSGKDESHFFAESHVDEHHHVGMSLIGG